jgi:drug/metabolite transporter (DMT)-like permease|tara:strand:- start:84 stop:932 length:849 start_codon:yes stop_codon:yes gene_type:complete
MKAVILNISAWMLLPLMDGIAKFLSQEIHFLQVVWGRYFFMAVFSILITSLFFKKNLIFPKLIKIQILRSSFLFLSTIFFFYAISVISMAEAITLSFISPIIATILSFVILKEKVGPRRWIAVLAGFVGVLFVIRPGFNEINLASIAAVGAGICYAFYLISTRKLSATDNPLMTLIFTGFTGCIVISLIVPFFWTSLSLSQWVLLISLAAIGTMAHFLIILSLSYAEASKLAPLGYSEIIMNVIIGYYFFGDFPDQWIWLGLIIIVASGIYISLRETKKTIV